MKTQLRAIISDFGLAHAAALITFSIKMLNEAEDGEPVQNKELERASSLNFLRYFDPQPPTADPRPLNIGAVGPAPCATRCAIGFHTA